MDQPDLRMLIVKGIQTTQNDPGEAGFLLPTEAQSLLTHMTQATCPQNPGVSLSSERRGICTVNPICTDSYKLFEMSPGVPAVAQG